MASGTVVWANGTVAAHQIEHHELEPEEQDEDSHSTRRW